jgi:hypothetical protein
VLSEAPALLDWDDDQEFSTTTTLADEFVVPSIKQKALYIPQHAVESWDDDFDFDEDNEVCVNGYIASIQSSLKVDMKHFRNFDLHIKGCCG